MKRHSHSVGPLAVFCHQPGRGQSCLVARSVSSTFVLVLFVAIVTVAITFHVLDETFWFIWSPGYTMPLTRKRAEMFSSSLWCCLLPW